MVLYLRIRMEYVRYGRGLSRLSSSVDRNPMPLLQPMVAAFGVVCTMIREATYLTSAVCEATASHLPLRFTKTSVQT